jgi:DNA-binding transcriptional MocR family regulator
MSRGKPSSEQLDICLGLLDEINSKTEWGSVDYRNYGINDGIKEVKQLFCELLEIEPEELIVSGNASLILMYDTLQRAMQFGVLGEKPWNKIEKVKWLCPVPGYDRHFAITQLFGIDMINIPMNESGPDMDKIEKLVQDESVKGIWCVPKYSNPGGIIYSDEVVQRFAKLKPAAKDFRVFWDNAYMVHGLYGQEQMLDVFKEAKKHGNEDNFYIFGSTSKITFAGAGIAFMYGSAKNMNALRKLIGIQTIGPDKIAQLAHTKFLKTKEGILDVMEKHANILRPKFEKVLEILETSLKPTGIATWTKPTGGYFISVNVAKGTAKETVRLAKELGVIFTGAGATFPYGLDPNDENIRIAPSLPPLKELITATSVFCTCAKLAYLEKRLGE